MTAKQKKNPIHRHRPLSSSSTELGSRKRAETWEILQDPNGITIWERDRSTNGYECESNLELKAEIWGRILSVSIRRFVYWNLPLQIFLRFLLLLLLLIWDSFLRFFIVLFYFSCFSFLFFFPYFFLGFFNAEMDISILIENLFFFFSLLSQQME